jgi:hypothetical protein
MKKCNNADRARNERANSRYFFFGHSTLFRVSDLGIKAGYPVVFLTPVAV